MEYLKFTQISKAGSALRFVGLEEEWCELCLQGEMAARETRDPWKCPRVCDLCLSLCPHSGFLCSSHCPGAPSRVAPDSLGGFRRGSGSFWAYVSHHDIPPLAWHVRECRKDHQPGAHGGKASSSVSKGGFGLDFFFALPIGSGIFVLSVGVCSLLK